MRSPILASVGLMLLAAPAAAATLRPMTTLASAAVRLSDLFDDAGANAARVLGPAPGLGGRVIVEAPQLAAIARQFGVDWRPASLADRAVLDRPGKPLARQQVIDPLRAALVAAGAPSACDVELPGFAPPLVPFEGSAPPVVTQVEFDANSGRFAAVLSVTSADSEPINLRIVGRVQETVEVPVAVERLAAGAVLRPGDIRMIRMRAGLLRAEVARDVTQIVGMALRHPASPGQPLPVADLQRPPLVLKGEVVQMQLDTPGIALAGQGLAIESAALGEHVRVLNTTSRAILDTEVIGPDRVRVRPDSMPVPGLGRTAIAAGSIQGPPWGANR